MSSEMVGTRLLESTLAPRLPFETGHFQSDCPRPNRLEVKMRRTDRMVQGWMEVL
jgi:hypothetical protein